MTSWQKYRIFVGMNVDNKDLAQVSDKEKVKKSVRVGWYIGKLYVDPLVTKVEVKKCS